MWNIKQEKKQTKTKQNKINKTGVANGIDAEIRSVSVLQSAN